MGVPPPPKKEEKINCAFNILLQGSHCYSSRHHGLSMILSLLTMKNPRLVPAWYPSQPCMATRYVTKRGGGAFMQF